MNPPGSYYETSGKTMLYAEVWIAGELKYISYKNRQHCLVDCSLDAAQFQPDDPEHIEELKNLQKIYPSLKCQWVSAEMNPCYDQDAEELTNGLSSAPVYYY